MPYRKVCKSCHTEYVDDDRAEGGGLLADNLVRDEDALVRHDALEGLLAETGLEGAVGERRQRHRDCPGAHGVEPREHLAEVRAEGLWREKGVLVAAVIRARQHDGECRAEGLDLGEGTVNDLARIGARYSKVPDLHSILFPSVA